MWRACVRWLTPLGSAASALPMPLTDKPFKRIHIRRGKFGSTNGPAFQSEEPIMSSTRLFSPKCWPMSSAKCNAFLYVTPCPFMQCHPSKTSLVSTSPKIPSSPPGPGPRQSPPGRLSFCQAPPVAVLPIIADIEELCSTYHYLARPHL